MAVTDVISKNYSEMGGQSKILMFGGLVAIVAIFIWLLMVVFDDTYEVLFTELEPHNAASIIAELDKNKIDYKIEDNGQKILVLDTMVHETRLKMVDSVPNISGGVGFEIFDKDDFGTTEFTQKINYQRALQGELARTIMSLTEIKFARVHLVLPGTSIFKRKQAETRASVTLILYRNSKLSEQQVSGIQRLVASSTPGLQSERVTILDQKGITLVADELDEHNITMASAKLHRKQEIEEYLTKKAQDILNQTFAGEPAYVSIDVSIDFNNIKKTIQQVIPSEGKDSNISHKKEVRMRGSKKEKADTSRSTIEVDYALSKEIEEIISTPGSINKLSIAIVTPKGLSYEQNEYVKSMVGNAIGFDLSRGDQISITTIIGVANHTVSKTSAVIGTPMDDTDMISISDSDKYDNNYTNWISIKMRELFSWATNSPISSFVLLVVSILFVFYLLLKLMFRPTGRLLHAENEMKISDEEKNKLLSDIKDWLASSGK